MCACQEPSQCIGQGVRASLKIHSHSTRVSIINRLRDVRTRAASGRPLVQSLFTFSRFMSLKSVKLASLQILLCNAKKTMKLEIVILASSQIFLFSKNPSNSQFDRCSITKYKHKGRNALSFQSVKLLVSRSLLFNGGKQRVILHGHYKNSFP